MKRILSLGVLVAGLVAFSTTPAARQAQDPVVPVHQEPRHHLKLDTPRTRVLDIQIPPGDTTLFHTHAEPILYVTMSTSRTRSQNLGGEWSAPAAAPGAPPATAPPAVMPTTPPGRLMSTISYAERPQTHRVNNLGETLFRLIGITNHGPGETSAGASEGFDIAPEIDNRWFRGYRRALYGEATGEHRHANPVVVVLVEGRAELFGPTAAANPANGRSLRLDEVGTFTLLDAGVSHRLQATGGTAQVIEVELR